MGLIAQAFAEYMQPLIDQTDGSMEQLDKVLALGQLCYNLALLPQEDRDEHYRAIQLDLQMDDEEFEDLRKSIILPMIQRHHVMFPPRGSRMFEASEPTLEPRASNRVKPPSPRDPYPGTDRYAPCPCQSGRKYKFCCGKR